MATKNPFNFSPEFTDKLRAAGYDPAKIEYGSVFEPVPVNTYKDEEGKVTYGYYDEQGNFQRPLSVYTTEPNAENSGAQTLGLFDTGKKGIVHEGRPVTVEVGRTPDNVISYVTLDYDPATQQPVPKVSYDRVASGGSFFGDLFGEALNLATSDAGKMLALGAGAGVFSPAAAGGAGALTGTDAALADLAASTPAFTGVGATEAALGGGLMAGSSGTGLQATGGLGLTGGNTANLASMGGAQGLTTAGATGALLGETGGALAAGGIGAGLGLSEAATGAGGLLGAGAAGAGGLTAQQMATAGLISGGLNTVGGLLQGETTKDAMNQLAEKQAALAEKTLQMGKFQPVGVTTRFGTSAFTTDPTTGAITPSYTLSPEAKAYQDALAGMGTQALTAGQGIMNLGQQYVGESPEAVRNRYLSTQRALLAPQQEQTLAALRNRQAATGRGGLAFGATSDGMMATNPEMAAYYNSLAQTERQLAANAETQYQNQVNFGTGLLGSATTPFTNVFGAQKGVELAAQQPLELSTNFANTVATRGAAQGANYATAMAPSLQAQYNANNYNPLATGLQGAASNPLTGYGLMKLTGLA
jgi:hypothetical protein